MNNPALILIATGSIMFLVIGGLSLVAHYYTLNGIKSRTMGDGQHGIARFASKQEIKSTYQHIPFQPSQWRKGDSLPAIDQQWLILGSVGAKNNVTALVDTLPFLGVSFLAGAENTLSSTSLLNTRIIDRNSCGNNGCMHCEIVRLWVKHICLEGADALHNMYPIAGQRCPRPK